MPLILVTGLPSSGKTTTAKFIYEELKRKLAENGIQRQLKLISDTEQLDWDGRDVIYNSIPREKELRGWIRTEAQRYINLGAVVILDVAAYIKGFRYELYCITKEAKTQYCVIERYIPVELCRSWNKEIQSCNKVETGEHNEEPETGYSNATLEALLMRYEKCDDTNRWDYPLFMQDKPDCHIDVDKIFDVIIKGEPLASNKCTSLMQTSDTIYKINR